MIEDYQNLFTKADIVTEYGKKFDSPLERLRHQYEVDFLRKFCRGHIFDVSIGTGRFVPELIGKHQISGMDFSRQFVEHVSLTYPSVRVTQGDLRKKLPEASNSFDTVICFRTLFGLPNPRDVIEEFKRICTPGGLIIFDFPSKIKKHIHLNLSSDSDWPEVFVRQLGLEVIKHKRADMLFSALKPGSKPKTLPSLTKEYRKAKKSGEKERARQLKKAIITQKGRIKTFRAFSSLERFLPDQLFILYENLCQGSRRLSKRKGPIWWNREFFVCRVK